MKVKKIKKYSKPTVVAKNQPKGTYAAGCPVKDKNGRSCAVCALVQ